MRLLLHRLVHVVMEWAAKHGSVPLLMPYWHEAVLFMQVVHRRHVLRRRCRALLTCHHARAARRLACGTRSQR